MSIRLYVGNLPKEEIDRQELQAVFAEAGNTISTKVIKDRKTGKCRGFGFVTVQNDEQADQIIEKFNGFVFKDSALKIEKALPRAKGQQDEEAAPQPVTNTSSSKPSPATSTPAPNSEKRRSSNKKKNRGGSSSSGGQSSNEAIQPDPRWAHELEKLKQMLAAQATNP